VTCYPREKNYGHRTPPGPCVPHGGTPEAPNRRRVVAPEREREREREGEGEGGREGERKRERERERERR
jgi:hypothetical protein